MSAVYMLNSVGERTPPCFELTLCGCVIYLCYVGVASLDVVCEEIDVCAWNPGLYQLYD